MIKLGPFDITNIITLDFETYYDAQYSLRHMTMTEYIHDKRFHVFGVSVMVDNNEPLYLRTKKEIIQWFTQFDLNQVAFCAHNQLFDGAILDWKYDLRPRMYIDTASMARLCYPAAKSHSLKNIAKMMGLEDKMSEVIQKMSGVRHLTPEQDKDLEVYCNRDTKICRGIYNGLTNFIPHQEWELMDLTTTLFTVPKIELDTQRLEMVINTEQLARNDAVRDSKLPITTLRSTAKLTTYLEELGIEVPTKQNPKGETIVTFEKDNTGTLALLQHEDEHVRNVIKARMRVMSSITENRAKRLLNIAMCTPEHSLPIPLKYYGAHTGRWSGSDKINAQNFPRGDEDTIGIRDCLRAPDGKMVVVADLGQIEARLTAWLADNLKMLRQFRDNDAGVGPDVYKLMATDIFKVIVEEITKTQRFVGKTCILGLGFGLGAKTLHKRLTASNPELGVTLADCENWVSVYRKVHHSIPMLWKKLDRMIQLMAKAGMSGTKVFKCLRYGAGFIQLPNQCNLQYPGIAGVEVQTHYGTQVDYVYNFKGMTRNVWGGTFTENIAQALARVLIAEQMLTINRKYPIATMTHDEIMAIVDEARADEAYDFMVKVMTTPPAWAPDLPLSAEGGVSKYYEK